MTDGMNEDDMVSRQGAGESSMEPGDMVERSPFTSGPASRGRAIMRAGAIVVLVGAAGAFTYFSTRDQAPATSAAAEHQHGAAGGGDSAGPVQLDADAARRAGVTFATAESGALTTEIRAVGQVTFDETRVQAIAPKVDGWVEHLFVDFTGREVREGEPLLSIYSPMLVAAQEELLLAVRLSKDVEAGTEEARRSAADLVAAARRRLGYWDIPETDIAALEQRGAVTKTLTLRAPMSGVVVEKAVLAGQKIMAGETLFRVADLRTVWVEGEIFERDLASIRPGVRVEVEFPAYPGEVHRGTLSYVYPTVDPATRTTRVRIALPNAALRLRPGLYATIRLPGAIRTGVVTIPRSAVLATGKRVIAFVRTTDGMLTPREVVTGLTSDDRVEVLSGLRAGEVVVASATFLVDAESNLGAALGPMTNMPGMDMGTPAAGTAGTPKPDPMASMPGMKGDTVTRPPDSPAHIHRPE